MSEMDQQFSWGWYCTILKKNAEYLERLEGKIRKCLFFLLKYSKITLWPDHLRTMQP
jgi:hypothetical protein